MFQYETIIVYALQEDSEFQQQHTDAFLRAADAAGDDLIRFVISESPSVFNQYNITSDSAVVIFRQVNCIILSIQYYSTNTDSCGDDIGELTSRAVIVSWNVVL